MQKGKTAKETAQFIIHLLISYFGEKVTNFVIDRLSDDPYMEFSIRFEAYKYFNLIFNYDRGHFGCAISHGGYGISLDKSQRFFDEADPDIFLKELQEQLELRIPDKFLEHYGWK